MNRNAKKVAGNLMVPDQGSTFSEEAQNVRWFLLPTEAQKQLGGSSWPKIKKGSGDKLTIRASSVEDPTISAQSGKTKKGKAEKKERIDADEGTKNTDCYNPFGTLSGEVILPIITIGHENRRKQSKAAWLTRQATEESDLGEQCKSIYNHMLLRYLEIKFSSVYY